MYLIDKSNNSISKIEKKRFADLGFSERYHLQEWILKTPKALGEELLIITKEFAGFDETKERLDLLALDKDGNLVIIENKLDDSGKDVVWQALKYVSYCSTLNKDQIVEIYQKFLANDDDAEECISEFLGDDLEVLNLNKSQRIILVANVFRKEVTSTVLWLLNHQIQIQCIKAIPYELNGEVLLNFEQIIPVPEISDYIISISIKETEEKKADTKKAKRNEQYEKFWMLLEDKLEKSTSDFFTLGGRNHKRTSNDGFWDVRRKFIGKGRYGYGFYFNNRKTRIEFFILFENEIKSIQVFEEFEKYKAEIHETFGANLYWAKEPGKRTQRIQHIIECDINNESSWGEIADSLVGGLERLEKAINTVLPKVKKALNIN